MATLRQGATIVVALATLLFGCSSSSDTSGGPLGNPECDGGCEDSFPVDSSVPDTDFHVDTEPTDTKGSEAPSEAASDAASDEGVDAASDG